MRWGVLIKTFVIFVVLTVSAGCYGWPEKRSEITGAIMSPDCQRIAVAVKERYLRFSLIPDMTGMSGRGVPKLAWQSGKIYLYDLSNHSLKIITEIHSPREFQERFEVYLQRWDNGNLIATMSGCSPFKGNADCYPPEYRYMEIMLDGKIKFLPENPPAPNGYIKNCASFPLSWDSRQVFWGLTSDKTREPFLGINAHENFEKFVWRIR